MTQRLIIAIGFSLVLAGAVLAPRALGRDGGEESTPVAPGAGLAVQAAPGGGEMIILGPELQYVIRARAETRTGVRGTCAHDAPAAAAAAAMRK
jgi:hypothetical protein